MLILEENFRWHLEAFASEIFIHNRANEQPNKAQVKNIISNHINSQIETDQMNAF